MKRKGVYITLVVIIFVLAITVRILNWPNAINDINCDEAMSAINANSIAKNGTDIYGTTFPIYFEGWVNSGQSAFSIYAMSLFIKIFGFSIISVRMPILLISISSLFFMFLLINKMFKNKKISLIILLLLAINPWDILQSQWSLDCNFYPHIMLIAIYLLYKGIEDKKVRILYFSMVVFAITLYTYGIALYLTPIFLLIVAIYLLREKKVNIKNLIICICLFCLVSLPIIVMTIINLFNLPTIHIGKVTIQNFSYSNRKDDMLIFSENKIHTLINNLKCLLKILVYQTDDLPWNAFSKFGTIYLISMPIIAVVLLFICIDFFIGKTEEKYNKFGILLILAWLFIGIICGVLINNININRINIIWYVLIIINGIGIYEIIKTIKYKKTLGAILLTIYLVSFIGFMIYYYSVGINEIVNSFTWSKGLVGAIEYVEKIDENHIVLSEQVSDRDKKDIFIRYGTRGKQKETNIKKEEFIKYYIEEEIPNMDFSTNEKEYIISKIEDDAFLTEPVYIITKQEARKISNIGEYQINLFNKYIVLTK